MLTRRRRPGLTLVEMLVAMALTLGLLALCTTIFVSASGSVNTIRGITEVDHKVRSAVNLIRSDLENAYLRDAKGRPLSPARLFTKDRGPAAEGYISIEENWPAVPVVVNRAAMAAAADLGNRQGIDSFGNPVDIDTDDVLSLTVKAAGTTPDTVFRGRAAGAPTFEALVAPRAAFDDPSDGSFTSSMAEVAYFLRPDGKQHLQSEINFDASGARPALPATYTLYRRQLLVLADEQVSAIEQNTTASTEINAGQLYQRFDLSVRFDPTLTTNKLRPNTLKSLSVRRNRFGMIAQQTAGGSPVVRELPFLASAYAKGMHQPRISNADNIWLGRPTLRETTNIQFPLNLASAQPLASGIAGVGNIVWADAQNDATATAAANGDGNMDTYGALDQQRDGEDILLTNVVSFDIKVLDDDFVFGRGTTVPVTGAPPGTPPVLVNPLDWPGYLTEPLTDLPRTHAVNPAADWTNNTNNPYYSLPITAVPALSEKPEFIDLGYLQLSTTGATGRFKFEDPAGGSLPFNYNASDPALAVGATVIDWGSQNVARWRTVGRNDPDQFLSRLEPISTYDSWSTQYNLFPVTAATDVRRPPYERPLRAIQITLRVLEPKTKIVREFQIVHRFTD